MNDDEIAERRAFFALGRDDEERLRALAPEMARNAEAIVDTFYRFLREAPPTAPFLRDPSAIGHLAKTQREYLLRLFSGSYDAAYVAHRMRVGETHHRIGLSPEWYLGAFRKYLDLVLSQVLPADDEKTRAFASVLKIAFFDIALALDAYVAAESEARLRQAAVIRELSTPVIELEARILLLPLVGAIDDERGELLMQTALLRVTERSARVIILDIAGVAVIDTATADRLVKTAAAVRLLGAEAIVTGVRPEAARTLVELGFDIGTLKTSSSLADGIELARSLVRPQARR